MVFLFLPFLVFYWQFPFLGSLTIGNDYVAFPISQQLELQYSLKHGSFPLYVPGFAGGQSATALTLGQMYHPISHVSAIMPGYWQGYALEWNTFFRLLSLGLVHLGLFVLLLRLGLTGIPAFLISFITVYNLRMLDLFRYGASLENYTGYLFLCLAMAFYYLKPSRFVGPMAIVVATYLLVCGGHPQMMYLGLLGAGLVGLVIPFALDSIRGQEKREWGHTFKYYGSTILCVLGGVLLAAIYIVPFYFDFLKANTERGAQDYLWSTSYACSTGGLLNNFFAPLQSEVQAAFGSSPIILLVVLVPLLYLFRVKIQSAIIGIWGVLVLIFLCGMGAETPVHYYFWKFFPMAKNFRIPGRMTMLFPFLFLLVLAWLFRTVKKNSDSGTRRRFSALQISIAVAAVLFVVYHSVLKTLLPKAKPFAPEFIAPLPPWLNTVIFWLGLLTLLLLLVFVLKKIPTKWQKVLGGVLVLVVVAQVTLEFRHGTWIIGKPKEPTLTMMNNWKKHSLRFVGDSGFGLETEGVSKHKQYSILETDIGMFYRDYYHVADQKSVYYFMGRENMSGKLLVERDPNGIQAAKSYSEAKNDGVHLEVSTFNRLLFSVSANAPGYFALSYPFSSYWRAWVDGTVVPIYRANGYRQAVFLEPGAHRVEFRYWSSAFLAGLWISGVVFLLLGGYFGIFVLTGKARLIMILVALLVPILLLGTWYGNLYKGKNLQTDYTWTTADFPPARNLAYAKRTLMENAGYYDYSGYAVDGRIGRPASSLPGVKSQWQVDLGDVKELDKIIIHDTIKKTKRILPLEIQGSLNGKTFIPLFTIAKRGAEMPLSIPMEGTITRFVRFVPSQKGSYALSEVQMIAPIGSDGRETLSPLIYMDLTLPVTATVRRKLAAIEKAIEAENSKAVLDMLEKEKKLDKISYPVLLHGAMIWAVERNKAAVVAALISVGATISPAVLSLSPQQVVDVFASQSKGGPGGKEIIVVASGLKTLGIRGKFAIKSEGVLTVTHTEPGKEGQRIFITGYDQEGINFNLENEKEVALLFIVRAKITDLYIPKKSYIFIQDFDGTWEKKKVAIVGDEWKTYVVSKKIRRGCTKLNLGIYFMPLSSANSLLVEEVRVVKAVGGQEGL